MSRPIALLCVASLVLAGCPSSPSAGDSPAPPSQPRIGAPPPPPSATTQSEVEDLGNEPIDIVPAANVGTLPGTSRVDRFGQAHYTIPLTVSPGVRGMQPSLALSYRSSTSNGDLGVGFALSGTSAISRCPRSLTIDGAYEPVRFEADDGLCLDGNRLVLSFGSYGLSDSEYRTRRNTFTKVVLHGDGLSRDSWFEVFRKDGRIQRYGSPSNWLDDAEQPLVWALDRESDRHGNEVRYHYDNIYEDSDQVELRLTQIRYGGTGLASTQRVVDLQYGPGFGGGPDRPDVVHGFFFGVPSRHSRLLESVVARGPGGDIHSEYHLDYGEDPITGRSRLEQVERCDRFGECMPPTVFTWKDDGTAGFAGEFANDPGDPVGEIYLDAYRTLVGSRQTLVGDFGGDFRQSFLSLVDESGGPEWNMWTPGLMTAPGGPNEDLVSVDAVLPVTQLVPSAHEGATVAMDLWKAAVDSGGSPPVSPMHLFQAPLDAMVIDAGPEDRRDDVAVPITAGGATVDDAGHSIANSLTIAIAQGMVSFVPGGGTVPTYYFDFHHEQLSLPTGDPMYAVVPLDHNGDSYTDFWVCEGAGYKSGEWMLVLANKPPNDGPAPVTYSFHRSSVGCSTHDELAVASPDGGRRQSLLVVPAYETDLEVQPQPGDPEFGGIEGYIKEYEPTPESARLEYQILRFEDGNKGKLVGSGLPRDHYQRWHDLLCRNGVADQQGSPPFLASGLGHDKHIDINGDGFVDVLRFELASGDDSANLAAIKAGLGDGQWDIGPDAPYNLCGDTLDDPVDAVLRVYWNTGAGYVPGPVAHAFDQVNAHATMWLDFVGAQLYDLNLDGRLDLVAPSLADGNGFATLISNGDGSFDTVTSNMPDDGWPAYTTNEAAGEWKDDAERFMQRRTFAAVWDGGTSSQPDLWFVGVDSTEGWGAGGPLRRLAASPLFARERITDIVDGIGARTEFEYGTDEAPANTPETGVFPTRAVRRPRTVVLEHGIQSSPNSELERWTHEYDTGFDDAYDGDFLGYDAVAKGSDGRRIVRRYDLSYDTDVRAYPLAGQPIDVTQLTELDDGFFEHASWTERTPTLATQTLLGGQSWFSYSGTEVQRTLTGAKVCATNETPWGDCGDDPTEVRTEVTTTKTLDDFGTPKVTKVIHAGGDATTTSATGITNDTVDWLLGQVGHTLVESCVSGSACKTREVESTYVASTGAVETSTVQAGTDDELSTTYFYDAHGNVTWTQAEDAYGNTRTTTAIYDDEGAFVEKTTNAAGHDRWQIVEPTSGAVAAVIDPNGITAVTHFDGFFRPVLVERRPSPMGVSDGAPAVMGYLDGEPTVPGSAFRIRRDEPGGQRIFEDFGASGHLVRSTWFEMRESVNYGDWLTVPPGADVVRVHWYDIRGREVARSLPTYESELDLVTSHAPHEASYLYDNLDRRISRVRPDGSTDSWTYDYAWGGEIPLLPDGGLLTVHTDADGRTDTALADSHGRIVRTIDGVGVHACMSYGAFGVHTRTSVHCGPGGAPRSTNYTHDTVGRVTSEDDPVSITRIYDHNGFGDVVYQLDGTGVVTDIEVDPLGRPTTITRGTEVDTFVWDSNLVGALTSSHSADGIEQTFHYDAFGRTSMSLATGFDPYVYATEYDYDAADRITEITFPAVVGGASPVSVAYEYDLPGYLRAIRRAGGSNEPLWSAISANAPAQIMHEQFGDETHVQRGYFPETLRPRNIWTHHDAGGPNLQSLWYSWTPAGELDYRNDQLHGQIESFQYDDARRLVESSANVGPAILTQTVAYDAYGNIEYKSDVGAYGYDAGGRLTSHGPPLTTLGYDANGNVTARGAQTLTYTPFEKVRTIEGGGASLSLRYDAQGQRVVREDAANDTTVITLEGMYEARVAGDGTREERVTVPTPTGSAVRIDRIIAPPLFHESTRHILSTYLGSGSVVANPDGSAQAEVSFDAWGAARDATDWTADVDDPTLVELGVGFTGHAAEPDAGLTNMGGRMYDPALGRFVQRDPVVADPANGADYGKYAYVRNRPLRLVDPSGLAPHDGGTDDDPDDDSNKDKSPDKDDDFGGAGQGERGDHVIMMGGVPIVVPVSNGTGQGAPPPETAPPDGGADCSGTFPSAGCYEPGAGSGNATQAERAMSRRDSSGLYNEGGLYKAIGTYAHGIAIAMGVVDLALVAGEAASGLSIRAIAKKLGPSCFAAGTLIATDSGLRPIEEVDVGDLVWARDPETGEEGYKPVLQTIATPNAEVLELTFESADGVSEHVVATAEHPFWSLDHGEWEDAGDLIVGERVDARHGPMRLVHVVESTTPTTVYNFEVDDAHTYFVGRAGVWVHNNPDCLRVGLKAVLGGTEKLGTTGTGVVTRQTSGGWAAAQAKFDAFVEATGASVATRLAGRGTRIGSGGGSVRIATYGNTRVILRESSTHAGAPTIEIQSANSAVRKIRFLD